MKAHLIISLILISTLSLAQVANTSANSEKRQVENINLDKYVDFAPSISADGKTMIFESDRNKGWKLFETKLDENGQWSEPQSIESINEFGRKNDLIAGPNISYDGNELYFFGFFMLKSESEDIFISQREAEGWSEPVALPAPINTEAYEGFPSISSDGKTLYFIRVNESNPEYSDESGNVAPCFEIWRAHKNEDGSWQDPEKLPAPINTGCERSPKIMADSETLLFSSIRDGGIGMYDMYQSTLQSDGSWSEPVALEYVNTAEDDLSPCISASGDLMYYYSNNDIYQVAIPPRYRQQKNITMEGAVTSSETNAPLASQIIVRDKVTQNTIATLHNNEADGWYSIVLTKGTDYEIEFDSPGYIPAVYSFNLIELEEYREEHVNVALSNKVVVNGRIVDLDLKTPQPANLTIRTDGESVATFANIDAFEFSMDLGKEYIYSIGADKFNLSVDTISTNGIKTASMNKEFTIEAKKIKFQMDVVDLNNNKKVKSKLIFRNKNRNETIEANSDEFVNLRSGDRYTVESASEGYFFGTKEINTDELVAGPNGLFRTKEPMVVTPIAMNSSLVLSGIRFETASHEINESSRAELDRIVTMLKSNTNVVIEISAHTDDVGDATYNLELSKQRAESAVAYLTEKGINPDNLVSVGYGMTRPAVPNDSDANRAINRRVEMQVIKIN